MSPQREPESEGRIAVPPPRLSLLVVGRARADSFKLPSEGSVRIGRAESCEIRIDDLSLGDEHAALETGRPLVLVDLGSGSPTTVAGKSLPARGRLPLSPGVVFTLGNVTFVIQQTQQSGRLRHIRSHDYFEARVEDECSRVKHTNGSFAVARFRLRSNAARAVEDAFNVLLRPMDVVAAYSPTEYEVLLLDVEPKTAHDLVAKLTLRMCGNGALVDVANVCFPSDAHSPEAIFSFLNSALVAEGPSAAPPAPEIALMERIRPLVERVAASNISVLLLGETGVGKEVMARALHALSPRSKKRLVSVNCASFSETLLESELFGYERGAFTGAVQAKAGLLETAEGGTVFLDEIGEMSLGVQARILRVLEHKEVARLGALTPRPIDVRFVAATNRDLELEVDHNRFRRDLYFRLAGFTIAIPPLRERVSEIESLALTFASEAAALLGRARAPEISTDALGLLERYAWPGNVRELKNVIDRAVLLCTDNLIEPAHLPLDKMGRTLPRPLTPVDPFEPVSLASVTTQSSPPPPLRGSWPPPPPSSGPPTTRDLADDERDRIVRALDQCGGNQTKAAAILGIARRTLINRIERYGLPRPKKA